LCEFSRGSLSPRRLYNRLVHSKRDEYPWSQEGVLIKLDRTPYGETLAQAVMSKLTCTTKNYEMLSIHRDYCGQGIVHDKEFGSFSICYVFDGYPGNDVKRFDSAAAFVTWLAKQSDFSLSGAPGVDADPAVEALPPEEEWFRINNQRITKHTLEEFVKSS
jgi:hypothetical protein